MGTGSVSGLSLASQLARPVLGLGRGPSWWQVHLSDKTDSSAKDPGSLVISSFLPAPPKPSRLVFRAAPRSLSGLQRAVCEKAPVSGYYCAWPRRPLSVTGPAAKVFLAVAASPQSSRVMAVWSQMLTWLLGGSTCPGLGSHNLRPQRASNRPLQTFPHLLWLFSEGCLTQVSIHNRESPDDSVIAGEKNQDGSFLGHSWPRGGIRDCGGLTPRASLSSGAERFRVVLMLEAGDWRHDLPCPPPSPGAVLPARMWSPGLVLVGPRGRPGDAEVSVSPAGELYRVSLRRQRFPAQGSIEIHEDSEVGWVSDGVWATSATSAC